MDMRIRGRGKEERNEGGKEGLGGHEDWREREEREE